MTSRQQALFLAHRIPYPPDKGDKIRSWRILERLAQRFDVHLAAFVDDADDLRHTAFLESVATSVTLVPLDRRRALVKSIAGFATGEALSEKFYTDMRMRRAVEAARSRSLALEVGFSSQVAQYLLPARSGCPLVFDLCDADSAKWTAFAETRAFPMSLIYSREAHKVAKIEARVIAEADTAFAISAEEAEALRRASGASRSIDWFSNGVDTDYFDPLRFSGALENSDVIFTGAMDYWANEQAALWFVKEIWPAVRAARPDATFAIVGSAPGRALLALDGCDGVVVAGRVPDIRPWLLGAKVSIAPMRIARGIQNKVLEAMAAARPVIATRAGAEGIDAAAGRELLIHDAPESWAAALIGLLNNGAGRAALGAEARCAMIERYSWASRLTRFDAAIDRAIGGR